jgi:putative ABC transport system permease protein
MRAVISTGWAAVRRRRLQTVIIAMVILLTSTTMVLAVGLLVASNAPFDQAFARQHGAHATVAYTGTTENSAVTATASATGVTAATGPFEAVRTQVKAGPGLGPPMLLVGRDKADTAVDKLSLLSGSWLTGPGQIVLSADSFGTGHDGFIHIGDTVTVHNAAAPSLKIVGIARSATGSADAWVWPTQNDVLHADKAVVSKQMLYRFASAATEADVKAAVAKVTAALPAEAVSSTDIYTTVKTRLEGNLAPMVPFVVAFAVLGLVMSTLIVVNVVAGAVVAGYRTIGVEKTLGFTPAQVVMIFAGQILTVCVPAALIGVVAGRLLSIPLLSETADAFGVSGMTLLPWWVDLTVLVGVPVIVGISAIGPAMRAGRLPAAQAVTLGRAPRSGRGFRIRRLLAATRLPRPISFGLGTPFARPARTAGTLLAVLLGATTVVFAVGLTASLTKVQQAFSRQDAVPVTVDLLVPPPGAQIPGPQEQIDPAKVRSAIQAQPGTARFVGSTFVNVGEAGSTQPLNVVAYDGDASWTGYPIISGRWYAGAGEAVAGSRMLRLTGTHIGDTISVNTELGERRVTIVGEVFANAGEPTIYTSTDTISGLFEKLQPNRFDVALKPGTNARDYVQALVGVTGEEGVDAQVTADKPTGQTLALMMGLAVTLATLLAAVAALGVFNTVVLNTRERIHEIGVLKSVGMTPRQIRTMVVTSMVVIGVIAGAAAVPLGWALHLWIMPVIGDAAGTDVPPDITDVYRPLILVGLGLAGVALAVFGALVPAGWAARTRVATALRAE